MHTAPTNFAGEPTSPWRATSLERRHRECGTLLLATLSGLTLAAAQSQNSNSVTLLVILEIVWLGGPWLIYGALHYGMRFRERSEAWTIAAIAIWPLLPILVEVVLRGQGGGHAPEILMLVCLQNSIAMSAAFSHRLRCRQYASAAGGFLVLYAIIVASDVTVFISAGVFGMLLLWWLMVRYWERIQQTHAASRINRCLPARTSILTAVAVGVLLAAAILWKSEHATYVLRGFMPTSGGDRWYDENARSGVGDGDALVAAQDDAMSFGPVESELFLDSEKPSLYDMFNDMYGEPPPPPKQRERSIGLSPGNLKTTEQEIAKTQSGGREFSTVRRKVSRRQRHLDDRRSSAMLYVGGRVPIHLAIQRYDTFDGRDWSHANAADKCPLLTMSQRGKKPWLRIIHPNSLASTDAVEKHAVKIINLKTNRVPAPPYLSALHIDKVDRLDFYGWTSDSVIEMPVREQIPELTVVRLESQSVNLESLRNVDFTEKYPSARRAALREDGQDEIDVASTVKRHLTLPADIGFVENVAKAWTAGIPRGWRQVEAVVHRLREEFAHDPSAFPPADCDNPVAHFLSARRGPDYLFATTAAVMLRSQGYATRLVGGFYARSDEFDRRAGQTGVYAKDVHVWCEVCVGGLSWVTIEATPGYDPPPEDLTMPQRIAAAWSATIVWTQRNAAFIAAGFSVAAVGWWTRVVWLDWLFTLFFGIFGRGNTVRRLKATLRLLECRAWLSGRTRPSRMTVSRFYAERAASLPADLRVKIGEFLSAVEVALYAPSTLSPVESRRISEACRATTLALRIRSSAWREHPPGKLREIEGQSASDSSSHTSRS